MLVPILIGSKSDLSFAEKIVKLLNRFDIPTVIRVSSAHKTPKQLLNIVDSFEANRCPKVYITVAGRSNALSGMVDGAVLSPVISCPPYSDKFGGSDIFSSVRMPSGISPALVLEPESAALFAAKILAINNKKLKAKIKVYKQEIIDKVNTADQALNS
jgi:phosphoribosylaminoimidazole carboxylase PurE protein